MLHLTAILNCMLIKEMEKGLHARELRWLINIIL